MPPLFAKIVSPAEYPAEYAVAAVIGGLFMLLLFLGVVGIGKWLAYVIDGPADRRRTRR